MFRDNEISDTAYVAGFSFPVKQLTFTDMKKDWEMGGIALNDPSAGLEYQLWEFTLEVDESTGDSDVYVQAPSVAKTLLFSGSFITEIAGCFDQNMNPMVAYTESGTPKIWWWDPTVPGMTHTNMPAGSIDLRCTLDDKRQFNVADSDIILSYVRAGALYFRLQRERYLTEHLLFDTGSVERLISLAMNSQWRLQWRLRGQSGATNALSVSEPFLGDIVYDIHRRSGILPEHIDVSDLYRASDIVPGLKVAVEQGMDKPIDWLMEIFQFTKSKRGRRIVYEHKGGEVKARIPYSHLVIDGVEQGLAPERVDPLKLPKKVNVNHIDSTGGFAKNKQTASRRSNLITSDEELNVDTNVVLTPDQAATAALIIIKAKHGEMFTYKFSTTIRYTEIMAADVVEVEDSDGFWHRMRIDERNEDDGVIEWDATFDAGPLTYVSSLAAGSTLDPPVSTTPGNIGDTDLQIFNMPVQRDQDDELVLYIGARGAGSGWGGYTLYYSIDAGVSYSPAFTSELPSNIGELVNSISDSATTFDVLVPYPLESVTASQIAAGENRAFVGDEEIQYQTAMLVGMAGGMYHYTLSGVVRGVLRTAKEAWSAGIRFVPYDSSIVTLQLQREHYGADFYYKAVSTGQSIDDVDPVAYLFDYAASQTEWAGTDVEVTEAAGGGITVTWVGAPRLGTFGPNPYHSKYMIGYRVKFSDGHTIDTTEQTVTYAAGLMGTPVEVRALNAITGEGPVFGGEGAVDPGDISTFGFSGSFPDAYYGIPYYLINGDHGISMAGGYWDANARGFIVPGVGAKCASSQLADALFKGLPAEVGSFTSKVRVDAGAPGDSGTSDINLSVDVLATPTHGLLDLRMRDYNRNTRLLASTPPWKKFDLLGPSTLMFYGVTSGKVAGQFIISGATQEVLIGIGVSHGELSPVGSTPSLNPFIGSTVEVLDGTYSIELDAGTGDFWIYEDGVGLIHSGNLALPVGKMYRIGISHSWSETITVECNGGNEAWFMAVTQAGHGGIPVPTPVLPLAWAYVDPDYSLSFNGDLFVGALYADDFGGGPSNLAKCNAEYSTGRWQWMIEGAVSHGICVSSFDVSDYILGSPGTPDSAGIHNGKLMWCFGGVDGEHAITFLTGNYPFPLMALDADNNTLRVYVLDHFGNPQLDYQLAIPSGVTWQIAAWCGVGTYVRTSTFSIGTAIPQIPGYSYAVVP